MIDDLPDVIDPNDFPPLTAEDAEAVALDFESDAEWSREIGEALLSYGDTARARERLKTALWFYHLAQVTRESYR